MRCSLLLVLALILPGVATNSAAAGPRDIDFEVVLTASHGYAPPGDYVFRDEASWCRFWNVFHAGPTLVLPPPCPPIDFQHDVVVASVSDPKPSSCHGLAIGPIERIRGRRAIRVTVQETAPARDGGCICLRVLTKPTQAVAVPRPVGRIQFFHAVTEFSCNGS